MYEEQWQRAYQLILWLVDVCLIIEALRIG